MSGRHFFCAAHGAKIFLLEVGDILLDDVEELAGADHLLHRTDVGPDLAVDLVERDLLADVLVERLVQRGETLAVGVQAATDVDGLAAVSSSSARTSWVFCRIILALRAAVVPMETISSWLAEEGMESTDAGCA